MTIYHPQSRISLFLCLLLALPAALPLRAQEEALPAADAPAIAIVPQDGFNMKIVDIVDLPDQLTIVTTLDPPVFNWFAGTFTNLPTDKEVTIGLSMDGMDTPPEKADVSKWVGLRPMMTYADPTQYETYEWFKKDKQGRWVSGDPFKKEEMRFAGMEKVPIQNIIPEELSEEFLSEDGTYWQAWREIETVEVLTKVNIIRIKQRFRRSSASIAMRVPYTYSYQQQFIERLNAEKLPGVFVDEIGATPEGRKLQLIRLLDCSPMTKSEDQRTILLIAREHATEAASSWVLHGALLTLLQDSPAAKIRNKITWLLIPIKDPDGSANSTFDRLTNAYRKPNNPNTPFEVFNYASFFSNYATSGRTIDVVVNLHGIETNEGPNIFTPFIDEQYQSITCDFNQSLFQLLSKHGVHTGSPDKPWFVGFMKYRLHGYIAKHFGSLDLAFEINDRFPNNRLPLVRIEDIGQIFAQHLAVWTFSEAGQRCHQHACDILADRVKERKAYYANQYYDPDQRTKYELLILGY